jgi:hypothetical protein
MYIIKNMCDNDPRHILTRARLKLVLSDEEYNKRFERYKKDCLVCGNDARCLEQAITNMTRGINIYPWINYDWDYSNYVDNNYSAQATGSSPDGGNLFGNLEATLKIAKGYLVDPNPGIKSVAGGINIDDRDSDFPVYGCQGNQRESCQKYWQVKQNGNLSKPYEDKFFNENSITGENASSYYFKIGMCNRNKINNKEDCIKKGYRWDNGQCIQDRYAYMNNTGGISKVPLKGFIPSLMTDIMAFSPNYIMDALNEQSSSYMKIQNCPEEFQNMSNKTNLYIGLLTFGIIITVIYQLKK